MGMWSDQPIPMLKGKDGYFTTSVELADGCYEYKFQVQSKSWFFEKDQVVEIADPYGTNVNDETKLATVQIKNGKVVLDDYKWKFDGSPLVPNNELVIYELHVGDFSGGEDDSDPRGRIRHVIEKLDYLADLGVNAIELMPVKEFPGDYSWGYTPTHFFSVERAYGTSRDLRDLVDQAHEKGIRVFVDGIYNHGSTETPLAHIDHDYWFHHEPTNKEHAWGPQFNYEHFDAALNIHPARKFISENVRYWIENYHIDGIRYDAAKQLGSFEGMKMMRDTALSAAGSKPFINIAEYLPEDPILVANDGPMDACWQDQFFWRITKKLYHHENVSMSELEEVLDPRRRGFSDCTQVVNYLSNHDHRRTMPKLADEGIFEDEAFARSHLAATILMTAVGIPMIWMGEEFGEYKSRTMESAKLDWKLLGGEKNRNLFNHYKRLIELRKKNEALRLNDISFFHKNEESGVIGYVRWSEGGKRVVVVANLSPTPLYDYSIDSFPCSGEWHEWIADTKIHVSDDRLVTTLGSFEGKVYVWW